MFRFTAKATTPRYFKVTASEDLKIGQRLQVLDGEDYTVNTVVTELTATTVTTARGTFHKLNGEFVLEGHEARSLPDILVIPNEA